MYTDLTELACTLNFPICLSPIKTLYHSFVYAQEQAWYWHTKLINITLHQYDNHIISNIIHLARTSQLPMTIDSISKQDIKQYYSWFFFPMN